MTETADIKSTKRWGWTPAITAMVVMLALVSGALWYFFSSPNVGKFAPVIQHVTDQKLTGDKRGRIDLSQNFPGLTLRDEMFVTWRTDGSTLMLFPNYYGKGPEIGGLLYTSRPLQESDTFPIRKATVLTQRAVTCGAWSPLVLASRINEHWYKVARE